MSAEGGVIRFQPGEVTLDVETGEFERVYRPVVVDHTQGLYARKIYTERTQFLVVKDGARINGLDPFGPSSWRGVGRALEVGEIVTCTGWHMGWGSDNIPQATFTADGVPDRWQHVSIHPQAGMWQPWPKEGYLVYIENEGEQS